MKIDRLLRQYDALTPQERFALILAAKSRGDETERLRLLEAAPRRDYSVPHHTWVVREFLALAKFHYMKLLELAADYIEEYATGYARRDQPEEPGEDRWGAILYGGYRFKIYLAAWQQFCAELHIEAEFFWPGWPGYQTVKRMERLAFPNPETGFAGAAFTEPDAADYLARKELGDSDGAGESRRPAPRPETAEGIAASLRAAWREALQKWQ